MKLPRVKQYQSEVFGHCIAIFSGGDIALQFTNGRTAILNNNRLTVFPSIHIDFAKMRNDINHYRWNIRVCTQYYTNLKKRARYDDEDLAVLKSSNQYVSAADYDEYQQVLVDMRAFIKDISIEVSR